MSVGKNARHINIPANDPIYYVYSKRQEKSSTRFTRKTKTTPFEFSSPFRQIEHGIFHLHESNTFAFTIPSHDFCCYNVFKKRLFAVCVPYDQFTREKEFPTLEHTIGYGCCKNDAARIIPIMKMIHISALLSMYCIHSKGTTTLSILILCVQFLSSPNVNQLLQNDSMDIVLLALSNRNQNQRSNQC